MARVRRRPARSAVVEMPRLSLIKPSPPLTKEVVQRLRRIPQAPARLHSVRHFPLALRGLFDYVTEAPEWLARARGRVFRYPAPFRKVTFPGGDGTQLTAWLGLHRQRQGARARPIPREAIVMVPGMFTTKDNLPFRKRAVRMFEEWGYHVLVLDLRGMGESSRVFNTAGWRESFDVEAAVEYLRGHAPVEKLHIYAESMGAVAALLAAARQADRGFRLVDGGLLAVSPYPDTKRMIHHLMEPSSGLDALYVTQWFFARLLSLQGRAYPTFEDYLRESARREGVTLRRLYRESSPGGVVAKINLPCLLVLSDDDPVVPPGEARRFARALRGRQNPAVLRLPWGSHCLHEAVDPEWFWNVLHEFFDFCCVLPSTTR